jgi:hypothetical protein
MKNKACALILLSTLVGCETIPVKSCVEECPQCAKENGSDESNCLVERGKCLNRIVDCSSGAVDETLFGKNGK